MNNDVRAVKEDALAIFHAAVRAADPVTAIRARWPQGLDAYRNIYVVGAGKAAARMAAEAERKLGKRIVAGAVTTKYGHSAGPLQRIQVTEAAHPVPDAAGVAGARRIADLVSQAGPDDLVLCLLSGGASALMPLPVPGLSLEEKGEITRQLLARGATIHQMNTVRKHLSLIKGGQLAAMAEPAHTISLILSDVVGDQLETIGSGPTAADPTTVEDAQAVLDRFGLRTSFLRETPKISHARNIIIGSNRLALEAAARKARSLGYRASVLTSTLEGEAREVARVVAALAREARERGLRQQTLRQCLILGGETTVTLRGDGLGGRNQELALAAAIAIRNLDRITVLSAGTDGTDGPTPAAGGLVTGSTADDDAQAALDRNDSYRYLDSRGALLITGPTGTNVMDIQLALIGTTPL